MYLRMCALDTQHDIRGWPFIVRQEAPAKEFGPLERRLGLRSPNLNFACAAGKKSFVRSPSSSL